MTRIMLLFALISLSMSSSTAQDAEATRDLISSQLDAWHQAAAHADADGVFSFMSDDAYYLGTDAKERWTKQEFMTFALPYFEKGKGWSFTVLKRSLTLSDDERAAWFNEELDTWMGVCFGSGILTFNGERWLLRQYHLALTVPNARIHDVLELLGNSRHGE